MGPRNTSKSLPVKPNTWRSGWTVTERARTFATRLEVSLSQADATHLGFNHQRSGQVTSLCSTIPEEMLLWLHSAGLDFVQS